VKDLEEVVRGSVQQLLEEGFSLSLACHPADSSLLLSSTSACGKEVCKRPEVMDMSFCEQQS